MNVYKVMRRGEDGKLYSSSVKASHARDFMLEYRQGQKTTPPALFPDAWLYVYGTFSEALLSGAPAHKDEIWECEAPDQHTWLWAGPLNDLELMWKERFPIEEADWRIMRNLTAAVFLAVPWVIPRKRVWTREDGKLPN